MFNFRRHRHMDLPQNLLGLEVAFLLGKHTAAVLLHIEPQFPGSLLASFKVGPKIPVQKPDAKPRRRTLGHLPHQFMLLVGTHKQG